MMRLGGWEIAVLLVVILLIFGPKRLPSLGKSLAQCFKGFKKEIKGIQKETQEIKENLKT